jgi:hypothetical protein
MGLMLVSRDVFASVDCCRPPINKNQYGLERNKKTQQLSLATTSRCGDGFKVYINVVIWPGDDYYMY